MAHDPDGFGHPDDPDAFDAFGDPGPEEMREIIEKLLREAWKRDADAQFGVALAYHLGLGVDRNHEEAIRWFRAAAKQGDSTAKTNLGVMHYNGAPSQLGLGMLYLLGRGVERDESRAVKWFERGARAGFSIPRRLWGRGRGRGG